MELSISHRFLDHTVSSQCKHLPPHVFLPAKLRRPKKLHIFTSLYMPTVRFRTPRASYDSNTSPAVTSSQGGRTGEVKRVTKETNVFVKIDLDGNAEAENDTGIPFLDHMLDQLASHGLFDMYVKATGDIHIDDHHTNEDVALAIGTALLQALGDRKWINRF